MEQDESKRFKPQRGKFIPGDDGVLIDEDEFQTPTG